MTKMIDDEEELTMEKDEDAGAFYRRQLHHRDTVTYRAVAFFFGLFFFVGSIIFFFLNAKKYFLPILFYDLVGTIMLIYALNLNEFENKKQRHENDLEDLKKDVADKKYDLQVK
jgi:hypothetical protein